MAKKEQTYVRAKLPNGRYDSVDVMLLDEDSFRAFVLDMLHKAGLTVRISDEFCGEEIELKVDPLRMGVRMDTDEGNGEKIS